MVAQTNPFTVVTPAPYVGRLFSFLNLPIGNKKEKGLITIRPITTVTQFIQEMSVALDKGKSVSLDEVKSHIDDGTLILWLRTVFPREETGIDFSIFEKDDIDYLQGCFQRIRDAYSGDERRKWGIENNGLCLLMSWATEFARDIARGIN